jgi:CRISPR-associated endonuclease Cas1
VLPVESFHLLSFRFSVLAPIRRLPHFHGPQWMGLFRNLINFVGAADGIDSLSSSVWVQPIETGILSYDEGDTISLGLVVPSSGAQLLQDVLERFNAVTVGKGHFQTGITVKLESAISRLTAKQWSAADPPLSLEDLTPEIERLCQLDTFSIETLSPLRIPRPEGLKGEQHRYCDAEYFLSGTTEKPFARFLEKVRGGHAVSANSDLLITGGAMTWLDVSYGDARGKTVGGVTGILTVSGRPSRGEAECLVWGQYVGVGKNAAFGLGFYRIPQLETALRITPLTRATTLFGRAVNLQALTDSLGSLSDSSPGPDGMSLTDARAAGPPLLRKILDNACSGLPVGPIPLKPYAIPKASGGYRAIHIQNIGERILHRAFANTLSPSLEGLLSSSAYAYRRGLSRKNAARTLQGLLAEEHSLGIKADIATFFDSVNTSDLCALLLGMYPAEPLAFFLSAWLHTIARQGISGLPQGWSLSPPLSNLYLERFDRTMDRHGFRLVRFADDFVVLCRGGVSSDTVLRAVESSLAELGLSLRPDKTSEVVGGTQVSFLGYLVSAEEIREAGRPDEPPEEVWLPVFRPDWQNGLPVYLTSICRGAYSSGPSLVVNKTDENSESIPWNRISRLVVVGRSSFSGGVMYRAVREEIPVTFIDVMGRTRGRLTATSGDIFDHTPVQTEKCADRDWVLDVSRRLVAAKIHNAYVLLRRNDKVVHELKDLEAQVTQVSSLESLRGVEGTAARIYFEYFGGLVAPFEFTGRVYRPPDGPVNVLLSFGYTLLYNRLTAVLADKGFNPRKGIFHREHGRHAALASDLLEPLRHLADRIVLSLIHLGEVTPDDFASQDAGAGTTCRMNGKGFRTFINRYEWTMASNFTPRKGQKTSYNGWLDETVDAFKRDVLYNIPYEPLRID